MTERGSILAGKDSSVGKAAGRRILYVSNEGYFFYSHRLPLARAMTERGYEVHIAAPSDHVWAPKAFSNAVFESLGFTFHSVPVSRRGMNVLRDIGTLVALFTLYRRLKPDIVHHTTIKPNLYGGLVARFCGIGAVVSAMTGLGELFAGESRKIRLLRSLLQPLLRFALNHKTGRVIVQNPTDLDALLERRITDRERCVLIRGSGVDLEEFALKKDPANQCPLVVLPSRLIWDKGVRDFVDAACILRQQGSNIRFALVGDTQSSNPRAVPEEVLRDWQKRLGIEWWGRREDMPDVFAQCDVVCLPSTYGEGVPKVLLEAAASGRAIVTTDHPGCRDVVEHGRNGLLVRPRDPIALANAINEVCTNPTLRIEMGLSGRRKMEAEFGVDLVVSQTMALYDALTCVPEPMRRRRIEQERPVGN